MGPFNLEGYSENNLIELHRTRPENS